MLFKSGFRYISLYRFMLSDKTRIPALNILDVSDEALYFDSIKFKEQMRGSLYPFSKMIKDARNTFKPWSAVHSIWADVLQPFYGILNIAKGFGTALAGAVLMIPMMLSEKSYAQAVLPFSWIVEGFSNIIRGATQLLFFPLVYLIKIPIRAVRTIQQKDKVLAESKPSIIKLANQAKAACAELSNNGIPYLANSLLRELDRKYCKAVKMGYPTNITEEQYKPYKSDKQYRRKLYIFKTPRFAQETPENGEINYLKFFLNK